MTIKLATIITSVIISMFLISNGYSIWQQTLNISGTITVNPAPNEVIPITEAQEINDNEVINDPNIISNDLIIKDINNSGQIKELLDDQNVVIEESSSNSLINNEDVIDNEGIDDHNENVLHTIENDNTNNLIESENIEKETIEQTDNLDDESVETENDIDNEIEGTNSNSEELTNEN